MPLVVVAASAAGDAASFRRQCAPFFYRRRCLDEFSAALCRPTAGDPRGSAGGSSTATDRRGQRQQGSRVARRRGRYGYCSRRCGRRFTRVRPVLVGNDAHARRVQLRCDVALRARRSRLARRGAVRYCTSRCAAAGSGTVCISSEHSTSATLFSLRRSFGCTARLGLGRPDFRQRAPTSRKSVCVRASCGNRHGRTAALRWLRGSGDSQIGPGAGRGRRVAGGCQHDGGTPSQAGCDRSRVLENFSEPGFASCVRAPWPVCVANFGAR